MRSATCRAWRSGARARLGKTTSISIRGANPNQVQVLVDGVRVKSPTLGTADLADIAPDLIERIEIIRGPQSTIYGADAIGGVVHIITKKGQRPATGWPRRRSATTTPTRRGRGQRVVEVRSTTRSASTTSSRTAVTSTTAWTRTRRAGRFGLDLPGNTRIGVAVRYNKTDTGAAHRVRRQPSRRRAERSDPNTRQESETYTASVNVRTRPVSWWEGEMRASRY